MAQVQEARLVPLRDSLVGRVLHGSTGVAYHLRDCIGEGGQGWVFRANWGDPSGHVVVVKVLRPDVVATEALRRFQREAEVLRRLSQGTPNPYVVRFYDHAVANVPSPFGPEPLALPYTVLEYVHGTTLEAVLKAEKRGLPVARVRTLCRHIALALDAVHQQKVVHRDLKPSNILITTEGGSEVAKVTDFGLVKLVDVNLARTTALAGASLGYAPPEQYEQGNERVSPRTDVFSLAAVTYEMLSGKLAFPFIEGENPLLIVTRILNAPRPSLKKVRANLPPELETNTQALDAFDRELMRAFAADPAVRHATALELSNALEPAFRMAMEERPAPPVGREVNPFEATARASDAPALPPEAPQRGSGLQPRAPAPESVAPGPVDVPPVRVARGSGNLPAAMSRESAPPEVQAGNPAAWSWQVVGAGSAPDLRAATFVNDGEAFVVGPHGFARLERGRWKAVSMPETVPATAIRGLCPLGGGSVLAFGDGGIVARIAPSGAVAVWRVPDSEITFHGAVSHDGTTTLVGERPFRGTGPRSVQAATSGVIAQFKEERLVVVADANACARLRGVARLQSGKIVACGDWGTIVRLELGVVDQASAVCNGHLTHAAATPDGGFVVVGLGGHALHMNAQLDAQLEAVQTTRDLVSLHVGADGQAWAGSTQARLVRRSQGSWIRMSGELGISANIIAITCGGRWVRAVGSDGALIQGVLH
ncbi:MAG: protein kinase [Polyangiaceae bacterium]